MSYKKDLENATNFEECQKAYDNECTRKYKRLVKTHGEDIAFSKMIAQNYSVWIKAQMRLLEIYPELKNSYDPDDNIQSRY